MSTVDAGLTGFQKGLAVVYSVVLLLASFLIVNEAWITFQVLRQPAEHPFYIDIMPFALVALLLVPVFIMLSYILLSRALPVLPKLNIDKLFKAALPCLLLVFTLRLGVGFFLGDYLPAKGFIYCDKLSRTAAFSGQVWVAKQAYCQDESYLVNVEVLDWFDEQKAAGANPSSDEVTAHIEKLVAQFKASRGLD